MSSPESVPPVDPDLGPEGESEEIAEGTSPKGDGDAPTE